MCLYNFAKGNSNMRVLEAIFNKAKSAICDDLLTIRMARYLNTVMAHQQASAWPNRVERNFMQSRQMLIQFIGKQEKGILQSIKVSVFLML